MLNQGTKPCLTHSTPIPSHPKNYVFTSLKFAFEVNERLLYVIIPQTVVTLLLCTEEMLTSCSGCPGGLHCELAVARSNRSGSVCPV